METSKKRQIRKKQPLYVTVHERIKDIISEEGLKPGDKLPSETELIELLGVSRGTVRQAVKLLRESGVIYNHQGKGSFLRPTEKNATGLEKVSCDFTQFASVPIEKRNLVVDYVPSSKTIQGHMGHTASTLMARFQVLYYYNDSAIAYRLILTPYSGLEDGNVTLDNMDEMMEFVDDLLQNHFVTAEMTIDTVQAREAVVQYMSVPANTHLFCISELARDKAHTPIAYSKFYCDPEFFKFTINRG